MLDFVLVSELTRHVEQHLAQRLVQLDPRAATSSDVSGKMSIGQPIVSRTPGGRFALIGTQ
jgi:hypothetical protein